MDATGAVTDRYDYEAFGNLISQSGTTPNVYLYSGEQNDPNLGLYYLRARYLSQSSGRFWTMDTSPGYVEAPLSSHKYIYAGDNPVDNLDPSGDQFLITAVGIEAELSILGAIEPQVFPGTILKRLYLAGFHGIYAQGHYVLFGFSHAFLRLVPADQDTWLRKEPTAFARSEFGVHFATVGAGPSGLTGGKLVKGIDRTHDVTDPAWLNDRLDVSVDQENDVIQRIFTAYNNYHNDLNYMAFPRPGYYNSNSYTSGLLDAAGLNKPSNIASTAFPGWDQPVPPSEFGR